MASRATHEILYDSEASLRLVDSALEDLRGHSAEPGTPAAIATLPHLLLRTYAEIINVLGSLRESRGALERAAVERIHHTHEKLREVSSATEVAATDIMDAVDRALGMVDELDAEEGDRATERSTGLRASIRDELFGVMNHLQFQDITTQQLNYASSVLDEMEQRLNQIAGIFDPKMFGAQPLKLDEPTGPLNYDPAATVANSEGRQALADEIFLVRGGRG